MALLNVNFFSRTLHRSTQMCVVLPDLPHKAPRPWKTLYLLHGMTDNHSAWQRRSAIERYAEEWNIAVILPDAGLSWYCDTVAGEAYFHFVSDELPRVCRQMFPSLSHRREDTFVAGLSMGGYGALKCALKRSDTFCKAASLSGALDAYAVTLLEPPLGSQAYWTDVFGAAEDIPASENDLFAAAEVLKENRPDLYIWCGREDRLCAMNRSMRDRLQALGYSLCYRESEGDHQWKYWDREIQSALKWMLEGEVSAECR